MRAHTQLLHPLTNALDQLVAGPVPKTQREHTALRLHGNSADDLACVAHLHTGRERTNH